MTDKSLDLLVEKSNLLEHQIAGAHSAKESYLLLNLNDGTLLKPIQLPPKGECEVDFYEMMSRVTKDGNRDLWDLHRHLPAYHGVVKSHSSSATSISEFIRMENVLSRFSKPCVIDIKMGRITYDPNASQEKIKQEIAKYAPLVYVGFVILGMKVFQPDSAEYVFYDRHYGRNLKETDILLKGLGRFFGWPDRPRREVVLSVLSQLHPLLKWFETQRQLSFYASSILMAYEGDSANKHVERSKSNAVCNNDELSNSDETSNEICSSHQSYVNRCSGENITEKGSDNQNVSNRKYLLDGVSDTRECSAELALVKMIDFTHVFPNTKQDENYTFGLRNLIGYLERLLKV